jgi:hypothetical protein
MNEAWKPTIGEVSWGTLDTGHLIARFSRLLHRISPSHSLVGEFLDYESGVMVLDNEERVDFLQELCDVLDSHAPDGAYFGSLEGDGSCFGFWPVRED